MGELKGLLNEAINRDDLIDAIKNRKVIYIYYDGDDDNIADALWLLKLAQNDLNI